MEDQQAELLYKILVVGDADTGKTCLIRRYVHNAFTAHSKATVGVDFAIKSLSIGGKSVTLQLWDIAGQERSRQMTRVYFQAAFGAAVVCDITKPSSFECAIAWKQDLDSKVFLGSTGKNVPCVLIVNKCDLGPNLKSEDEMSAFCKEHGFLTWFETSAKNNTNVEAPFSTLTEEIRKATGDAVKDDLGKVVLPAGRTKLKLTKADGTEKKSCPC